MSVNPVIEMLREKLRGIEAQIQRLKTEKTKYEEAIKILGGGNGAPVQVPKDTITITKAVEIELGKRSFAWHQTTHIVEYIKASHHPLKSKPTSSNVAAALNSLMESRKVERREAANPENGYTKYEYAFMQA